VLLTKLTITRLVIMPAIVVSIALVLGFRGNDLAIITLCGACPIATSVYPMALVYDSDADLTGQLVITTSLFCCFTLFLWVFAGKQLGNRIAGKLNAETMKKVVYLFVGISGVINLVQELV
jgi:predicted permease